MSLRVVTGLLGGGAWLLVASLSYAQCRMDNDCPGEQICEDAACVAPPPAPPAAAAPTPPPPAPTAPATTPQPAAAPAAMPVPLAAPPEEDEPPTKPKGKRHSRGMMAGGIVMTSLSFIPFLVMFAGTVDDNQKMVVGGFFSGVALVGAGIPLIVIGARREQAPSAAVAPWATPHGAGFAVRFAL